MANVSHRTSYLVWAADDAGGKKGHKLTNKLKQTWIDVKVQFFVNNQTTTTTRRVNKRRSGAVWPEKIAKCL